MKIHILRPAENSIEGFERVETSQAGFDLSNYSNNECELIFANNILDIISMESLNSALQAMVSKLRIGGSIVLGGTDVRLLAKSITGKTLGPEQISNIFSVSLGMYDPEYICKLLRQLGLTIETSIISGGMHYEIKATRKQQTA